MMKIFFIGLGLFMIGLFACQDVTIGYLKTEEAQYAPDSLIIYPKGQLLPSDPRIQNDAPWVTSVLQGFSGTKPILFSIDKVVSSLGEMAASEFKEELTINGDGSMYYPMEHKAPAGVYDVSVRLTNEGYSKVIENAFTFIVKE